VKALFFDLDGTVTDINRRETEVIFDTVSHFGLSTSKSRVKQLICETASYVDVFKELGFELTEDARHYWNSAFIQRYDLSVVRRGVKSTLKTLCKKYLLVCVTSRETLSEVFRELTFLRINYLFNHVVTREVAAKHFALASLPFSPFQEHRKKLYECALSIAKCTSSNAVVIGDMPRELKPARDLGIATIGLVLNKAREKELRETSDFLISSITQLQNVLPRLNSRNVNV